MAAAVAGHTHPPEGKRGDCLRHRLDHPANTIVLVTAHGTTTRWLPLADARRDRRAALATIYGRASASRSRQMIAPVSPGTSQSTHCARHRKNTKSMLSFRHRQGD